MVSITISDDADDSTTQTSSSPPHASASSSSRERHTSEAAASRSSSSSSSSASSSPFSSSSSASAFSSSSSSSSRSLVTTIRSSNISSGSGGGTGHHERRQITGGGGGGTGHYKRRQITGGRAWDRYIARATVRALLGGLDFVVFPALTTAFVTAFPLYCIKELFMEATGLKNNDVSTQDPRNEYLFSMVNKFTYMYTTWYVAQWHKVQKLARKSEIRELCADLECVLPRDLVQEVIDFHPRYSRHSEVAQDKAWNTAAYDVIFQARKQELGAGSGAGGGAGGLSAHAREHIKAVAGFLGNLVSQSPSDFAKACVLQARYLQYINLALLG